VFISRRFDGLDNRFGQVAAEFHAERDMTARCIGHRLPDDDVPRLRFSGGHTLHDGSSLRRVGRVRVARDRCVWRQPNRRSVNCARVRVTPLRAMCYGGNARTHEAIRTHASRRIEERLAHGEKARRHHVLFFKRNFIRRSYGDPRCSSPKRNDVRSGRASRMEVAQCSYAAGESRCFTARNSAGAPPLRSRRPAAPVLPGGRDALADRIEAELEESRIGETKRAVKRPDGNKSEEGSTGPHERCFLELTCV